MITVSYNAYCAISKEGDNDIWTVRPRGVVPLLPVPWCSQIDVGATVNALLGDTSSRENNTHGSRFHDRDPQLASRILGAMTQSCYIGTRDIRSRVIRGPYCMWRVKPQNIWRIFIALCMLLILFVTIKNFSNNKKRCQLIQSNLEYIDNKTMCSLCALAMEMSHRGISIANALSD